MTHLTLDQLTKAYHASSQAAVDHLSLQVTSGQLVALLGPSGCGKTTILKMIAGLLQPTSGQILFDGEDVSAIPASRRGAVMVFQNHLLFPYMSVGDNIGFGLKMRGESKQIIQHKVADMLARVQLPDIAKRRPAQLSGGQQQRVALARALITEPRLLLLDEPLSNLDAHLRDEMRDLILSIQRERQITTIVVTHDQEEAVLLADKIALIFDGQLQQYSVPQQFYRCPASQKVATFFGAVNLMPAHREGQLLKTAFGTLIMNAEQQPDLNGDVLLTIRPEQIVLNTDQIQNTVTGQVQARIYVGTHTRYKIQLEDYQVEVLQQADFGTPLAVGDVVSVHMPIQYMWLLPQEKA